MSQQYTRRDGRVVCFLKEGIEFRGAVTSSESSDHHRHLLLPGLIVGFDVRMRWRSPDNSSRARVIPIESHYMGYDKMHETRLPMFSAIAKTVFARVELGHIAIENLVPNEKPNIHGDIIWPAARAIRADLGNSNELAFDLVPRGTIYYIEAETL